MYLMKTIDLSVCEIKNISNGDISIPLEKGIYCIAGSNGSGKSTLMSCLAQLVYSSSLSILRSGDYSSSSYVEFAIDGDKSKWTYSPSEKKWVSTNSANPLKFNGLYEGSLFYGTRFKDSLVVDELVRCHKFQSQDIVDADDYVKQKLSYILQGDLLHYTGLKRVRNKSIAQKHKLKNTPYFDDVNGTLISQYRMSSGECLLISLLHFIYNSLIRRSLPANEPILMLIDEIELALHPVAVTRFIDLLSELVIEHPNLTVILTSHSPEVIRKINPNNLFVIEHEYTTKGIRVTNPCYPSYAIRDVYAHDGYDYVILVEDLLAKYVVDTVIKRKGLNASKLINILPVGGWDNVLRLQHDLYQTNTFGIGTKIFSILDGDVETQIPKQYEAYPKYFLPIPSVEKYIHKIVTEGKDPKIKKEINDNFFMVESIDNLLSEYYSKGNVNDNNGKKLYRILIDNLEKRNVDEETFTKEFCSIIMKYVQFNKFEKYLETNLR